MSSTLPLIVCEKSGLWGAALRWQSGSQPLAIKEVRSLIDARASVFQAPTSLVALEATAATAEGVLRLMLELQRVCPASRCIVLLAAEARGLTHLYQEAGALHVAQSPRRLDRVVQLVERLIARQEPPEQTNRERVWERLPWGDEHA